MDFVVDTNILIKGFNESQAKCLAILFHFYGNDNMRLVVDFADGSGNQVVLTEYRNNLGDNAIFQKWLTAMYESNQMEFRSGKLDSAIRARLNALGFHESTDQTFVAVTLQSDKIIITEDSDYGVGDNPKAQDVDKQAVLQYLTNELLLKVMDSSAALSFVRTI